MFNFFKKKKALNGKPKLPTLIDLNNQLLTEGDLVEAYRYELGESRVILEDGKYYYESIGNGKKVIWTRMIDAITEKQKVKKID